MNAVLVPHLDEWVLIAEDDEPERLWQAEPQALAELTTEGWQMTAGPALVEPDKEEFIEGRLWRYWLTRSLQ